MAKTVDIDLEWVGWNTVVRSQAELPVGTRYTISEVWWRNVEPGDLLAFRREGALVGHACIDAVHHDRYSIDVTQVNHG